MKDKICMKDVTSLEYQLIFIIPNQIIQELLILDRIPPCYLMENRSNESDEVCHFILNSITLL